MDIIGLIPQFGGVIWMLLAFIVALSVIVFVHEYGHYIVGRWSGIHADVFSVGFGPVLWSRFDKRGTQWQIAALPFGGYVKFKHDKNAASAGEAEGVSDLPPEELRQTMVGAPLWARTATVLAGPVFNFIFSFIVFMGVFLYFGQPTSALRVGEVKPVPYAVQELQAGDQILSAEGITAPKLDETRGFSAWADALPVKETLAYTVMRDGQETVVQSGFLMPPLVLEVLPGSAAYDASLKGGDVITAINGDKVFAFSELKTAVEGSNGAPLDLVVWRNGETLDLVLAPKRVDEPNADGGFTTQWRIGIAGGLLIDPARESVGVGQAASDAVSRISGIMTNSLSALKHMVTGAISTCNMSGPIGIAQASGGMASQGLDNFIIFIAVLSTAVGLLNLFPIPALDGGHLMFYAYEAVARRKPPMAVMTFLMNMGVFLVLSLMAFALYNDLTCP